MTNFEKYQYFKNLLSYNYNGHDLEIVNGRAIAEYSYGLKPKKKWYKLIIHFFFIRRLALDKKALHYSILIEDSYTKRRDYRFMMEETIRKFPKAFSYKHNYRLSINYNMIRIFKSISFVITQYRKNNIVFDLNDVLFFALKHEQAKLNLDYLDLFFSKNEKIKHFICHNCVIQEASFVTSALNKVGVHTYTLQHGLYPLFVNKVPVDIVNYENLISKFLLCWGQSTVDNLVKFGVNKKKLLITGHPVKDAGPTVFKEPKFRKVLVLSARKIYNDINYQFLECLNRYNENYEPIKFEVKLHPSLMSQIQKYSKEHSNENLRFITEQGTISELLDSGGYDACLSTNSTAYLDALSQGFCSLRFTKNENEYISSENDSFQSAAELHEKVIRFRSMDAEAYNKFQTSIMQRHLDTTNPRMNEVIGGL